MTTQYKMVGGQLVPLSDNDLSAKQYDSDHPPAPLRYLVPLPMVDFRMRFIGKWDAMMTILNMESNAAAKQRLFDLFEGIYSDDAEARALIAATGADPDEILRVPEEFE